MGDCLAVTMAKHLLVFGFLALCVLQIQALDITPPSPKCSIIRENARKMFGSTCFRYTNKAVFRGTKDHKKHDFISWLMTSSGVPDPFASTALFRQAWGLLYKPPGVTATSVGDWYPVTGAVMEGDIVVQPNQINVVVQSGTNPVVLQDGVKVAKHANKVVFDFLSKQTAAVRTCPGAVPAEDVQYEIDPSSPPSPCNPWVVGQKWVNKLDDRSTAYWCLERAQRARINFFAEDHKAYYVVYRYLAVNPVGDTWSEWGAWGSCSVPCGTGVETRTRTCIAGTCFVLVESEEQACTQSACPVDTWLANTYNGEESKYGAAALEAHNYVRRLHGTPDMTWDAEIAVGALAWALTQAEAQTFDHDLSGTGLGENLFQASASIDVFPNVADAVYSWYKELTTVPYTGGKNINAGHFSQVIWEASVSLGCGGATYVAANGNKKTVIVCRYSPPGNSGTATKWNNNIPLPSGLPTVTNADLEMECFNHGDCTNSGWCGSVSWYPKYCPLLCSSC